MSAGKRFKWAHSEIQFLSSYDDASPLITVTAITKADPPVVSASHGQGSTVGTIFVAKLESIEGMTEVDDEVFIMRVLTSGTAQLLNTDSTGYGTFSGTGLLSVGQMTDWCEITSLNRQGGSSPEIPATTVCSDFAEFEIGLPDFGSASFDFNYAPLTTVQEALDDFQQSGDKTAIHYSLPRSGGERWVLGFIQQTGEQGANGGLWTGSATFRATGAPVTVTPA